MKFTIQKSDFRDVLSKVQGLTNRKTSLAVTNSVLIRADASGISITATDLETGFEGTYPAEVESEGIIAVNSRKLYEIARDFPTEAITLNEVENRWIEIGSKNVEYHLVGMDPDEFPDTPHVEDVEFFDIDALSLKKMIERSIIITVSSEDKRAQTNGVFFDRVETEDEKMAAMVSTDISRLSLVKHVYAKDFPMPTGPGVLIPKKGLSEAVKFLDVEGTAQVGVHDSYFIIKQYYETVIMRLLEGNFPDYKEIFSRQEGYRMEMNRHLFLMTMKRMSILSSEDFRGVIFSLEDGRLTVNATNPDVGESKEELDIDFTGDPIEVAFNPRYFIEALNAMDEDKVILRFMGEKKPCFVRSETDESFITAIMSMRI